MEPKPVKTFPRHPQPHQGTTPGNKGWSKQDQKEINRWNNSFKEEEKKPIKRWFDDWDIPDVSKEIDDLAEYDLKAQSIYNFAKDLFNYAGEEQLDENEDLEDMLDLLAEYDLTPEEIAKAVINDYAKTFAKHFPKASAADFVQYTHETLDLLEDVATIYPEIRLTLRTITSMINKFIENETKRHLPAV